MAIQPGQTARHTQRVSDVFVRRVAPPTGGIVSRHAVRKVLRLRRRALAVTLACTFILAASLTVVMVWQHSKPGAAASDLTAAEQAVSRHYLLPTGEEPVLATVTDERQLSTPFLKQAKDGDRILIYTNAKIIVIYRPSIDRIVAVGPVEVQAPASGN